MSALANETLHKTVTFQHFGRDWTVPTKRNASHLMWMQTELRLGVVASNLMAVQAFLSPEVSKSNQQKPDQFAALMDIDPDEDQLDEFADKLSTTLGLGDAGNS